jgi:hypothetical protein
MAPSKERSYKYNVQHHNRDIMNSNNNISNTNNDHDKLADQKVKFKSEENIPLIEEDEEGFEVTSEGGGDTKATKTYGSIFGHTKTP